MKHDKYRDELLQELARKLNVVYLSDLALEVRSQELCQAVVAIPENKYDIDEWYQAVSYIAYKQEDDISPFHSVAEAKEYLLNLQFQV